MDVVAAWTGDRADALRQALRMTNESFAAHLGVAVRTVAYWRERPAVIPRPGMQEILDTALARAPAAARMQFSLLLAERQGNRAWQTSSTPPRLAEDVASLTAWITATNTSDEAIEHIERATGALAERHTQVPARQLLADVLQVHDKAQLLLRSGRQRLRQTRELIRVEGSMLAHASVLLGDLGQDQEAERYGRAALVFLREADANQATAWYALAKTARWQHDYGTAADLAQQGFEHGPEALPADGTGGSPWSFPAERRAIFRLSVLLRTGDPGGALIAAEAADRGWDAGDLYIPGTWAQVRIGAAIARLLQGSLDGAEEQVSPMLTLAPEFRIATVTGWLDDLDKHLTKPRFATSPTTNALRQQIREFRTAALPLQASGEAG